MVNLHCCGVTPTDIPPFLIICASSTTVVQDRWPPIAPAETGQPPLRLMSLLVSPGGVAWYVVTPDRHRDGGFRHPVRESLTDLDPKPGSNLRYDLTVWPCITNLFIVPPERIPSWPGSPKAVHGLGEPRGVGPSPLGFPQTYQVTTRDSLSCTDLERAVGIPSLSEFVQFRAPLRVTNGRSSSSLGYEWFQD